MKAIFWHRRDLRIDDNAGLYHALKNNPVVQPIFIFDTTILNQLPSHDQRVLFIHQQISQLKLSYQQLGSDLLVYYGNPTELIPEIAKKLEVTHVYTNRDYEPKALDRDKTIYQRLQSLNIDFIGAKDHVIFEKNEVLKADGTPYTVFTPYSRKWKEKLTSFYYSSYPTLKYTTNLQVHQETQALISLNEMGFEEQQLVDFPSPLVDHSLVSNYHSDRDFPAKNKTSRLSIHLRFGTISIRRLVQEILPLNETFLNELIWRDFYFMILFHFPHSATKSFKPAYDAIQWDNNESLFQKWCEGKTGYPLVDAGMRELNATGFMHNRVRMVVASFLCKHLQIDWRWGEGYFAKQLLDYEQASNIGGWQWAASTGCDAAPYFRIFNPASQLEKFDKQLAYIKKWVPEFGTSLYPAPIVDHKMAREKALSMYKSGIGN